MKITRRYHCDRGFTLVELAACLVVGALMLIAFAPALQESRAEARAKICVGNLAQIGRAVAVYADAHQESFPGDQHHQPSWMLSLGAYASTNAYRCPEAILTESAQRRMTIALNDFLTRRPYGARHLDYSKRSGVPAPEQTMMFGEVEREYRDYDHFHFADAKENGFTVDSFGEQVAVEQHDSEANYLFVDGRVDQLGWNSAVKAKLSRTETRFVHPGGETPHRLAGR